MATPNVNKPATPKTTTTPDGVQITEWPSAIVSAATPLPDKSSKQSPADSKK